MKRKVFAIMMVLCMMVSVFTGFTKNEVSPVKTKTAKKVTTVKTKAAKKVSPVKAKAAQKVSPVKAEAAQNTSPVKAEAAQKGSPAKAEAAQNTSPVKAEAAQNANPVKAKTADEVDLKGMYTVKDPSGVEFDKRYALYKPYIKTDDKYAEGARYTFSVIYAKKNKGQYMYSVDVFETEKQAADSQKKDGKGIVDGKAVVIINDAAFFKKMEGFVPTVNDWINNLKASGLMSIEK